MTESEAEPALRRFSWRDLLLLFAIALAACAAGTWFSYNGPLTSPAWREWVEYVCGVPSGSANGAVRGPVVDMVRAGLGASLALFAFYRLSIVPDSNLRMSWRRLNWIPDLRRKPEGVSQNPPDSQFEARFSYEKWVLLGFLVLAFAQIAIVRPFDFLVTWQAPANSGDFGALAGLGFWERFRSLYTSEFFDITRPYLFPYSLYILALWYCIALPTLLVLFRSLAYDVTEYSRLRGALDLAKPKSAAEVPPTLIAIYESRCLYCFDFINEVSNRYASVLVAVLLLCYVQQARLTCSVLNGASNVGKTLLLAISVSSLSAIGFLYLRLHYNVRTRAKEAIDDINNALVNDPTRASELRTVTAVAEVVRKRNGVAELNKLISGASIATVLLTAFWKIVLHHDLCVVVHSLFPSWTYGFFSGIVNESCAASTT